MRRDEVIAKLKTTEPKLREFGVAALYLFGSHARATRPGRRVASPIVARCYQVSEPPPHLAWPWHRDAQQDDTGCARQRRPSGLLAEILVEGQQNALMPAAAILTQMMSCPTDLRAATAAAGKFSLARKRMSGCAREYFLRVQRVAGIRETGDDIVVRDNLGSSA